MLTDRQKNFLDFIQNEQREKGITPSTREIQNHFGFASQTSVMQYIAALEKKGFLDRRARKARSLITPLQRVRITDIPIYGQIPAGMATWPSKRLRGMSRSMPVRSMLRVMDRPLPCACEAIPWWMRTFSTATL